MRSILKCCISVVLILAAVAVAECSDSNKEKDAAAAADAWLSLIDSGRYSQSWREAAGYFKGAVKETDWTDSMNSFRKPLGKAMERRKDSVQYMTSLPGAPDGEYVVIQYRTRFENKKEAVETVTPMLDTDGKWRVSGYYIK